MQNKGFIKYQLHEINYVLGIHCLRAPKKWLLCHCIENLGLHGYILST